MGKFRKLVVMLLLVTKDTSAGSFARKHTFGHPLVPDPSPGHQRIANVAADGSTIIENAASRIGSTSNSVRTDNLIGSTPNRASRIASDQKRRASVEIDTRGTIENSVEDIQKHGMTLRGDNRLILLEAKVDDAQHREKKQQFQIDASRTREDKGHDVLQEKAWAARERETSLQNSTSNISFLGSSDSANKHAVVTSNSVMSRGKLTSNVPFHMPDCSKSKQITPSAAMHVVVSRWRENVNWILDSEKELERRGIVINICDHNGPFSLNRNQSCDVPYNRGTEGSAYLRYILTNWDQLPDVMVFTDAAVHPWHWHQNLGKLELFKCLQASEAVEHRDMEVGLYVGLNGHRAEQKTFNFCGDENLWMDSTNECTYKRDWNILLRPYGFGECPSHVVTDGSSVFLVTRERVRSNPYEMYQGLYDFSLSDGVHVAGPGYFLEWVWSVIFREGPIYEPLPQVAANQVRRKVEVRPRVRPKVR